MTDFLYPFIESDERDAGALLDELARSATAKIATSMALRQSSIERERQVVAGAVAAMARAFDSGATLHTFGNGGSSTDASSIAALFRQSSGGRRFPARCLVEDAAVLTALGNDVGFDLIFSRQLMAHAAAGDIALGVSTSGNSDSVLAACGEARRRGMITVGLAGYDGGAMASSGDVDHCIVVRSDSVHRIQEAQAALAVALREGVDAALRSGVAGA